MRNRLIPILIPLCNRYVLSIPLKNLRVTLLHRQHSQRNAPKTLSWHTWPLLMAQACAQSDSCDRAIKLSVPRNSNNLYMIPHHSAGIVTDTNMSTTESPEEPSAEFALIPRSVCDRVVCPVECYVSYKIAYGWTPQPLSQVTQYREEQRYCSFLLWLTSWTARRLWCLTRLRTPLTIQYKETSQISKCTIVTHLFRCVLRNNCPHSQAGLLYYKFL